MVFGCRWLPWRVNHVSSIFEISAMKGEMSSSKLHADAMRESCALPRMQVHEQTYKPHGTIECPVCKGSDHEPDLAVQTRLPMRWSRRTGPQIGRDAERFGRPVMKELPTPTLDLSPLKLPRRWTFPKPVFGDAV